eukprot:scaffold3645_cov140-Chaetoceros_neogracile.AAC.3
MPLRLLGRMRLSWQLAAIVHHRQTRTPIDHHLLVIFSSSIFPDVPKVLASNGQICDTTYTDLERCLNPKKCSTLVLLLLFLSQSRRVES